MPLPAASSAATLNPPVPHAPRAAPQVTRAVLLATACIVAGCMLLVSFGDHSSRVFTAKDLLRLYAE